MSEGCIELEYGDGNYTYYYESTFVRGRPENKSGHPDNWHPSEPEEIFITDIKKEGIDGQLLEVTGEEEEYVIDAVLKEME